MKTFEKRRCDARTSARRFALALLLAAATAGAYAAGAGPNALREAYTALGDKLQNNAFQRPLHLESKQGDETLQGEIHAIVTHPFSTLKAALDSGREWCDILILHPNVKQCMASGSGRESKLTMHVGRKLAQPVEDAHRVDFSWTAQTDGPDHLHVAMRAPSGPLGTRDYRIEFEAAPLDAGRSFIRMSYAYVNGLAARLAMEGYLRTVGRDKVGFSVVGKRADGQPVLVGGMRGAIERNTMRYYLAIDAYLASLAVAPADRTERRLRAWYAATERYPQLREQDEAEYLEIKRNEIKRQQAA